MMTPFNTPTDGLQTLPRVARHALLLTAALGLPLSLATPALAQCNISRIGTPDFDQKRTGLPNDGQMYCVPTAVANFMALLANSGYPEVFGVPNGGIDYQFVPFGEVTGRIAALGNLMSTSPTGGTNLANAISGTEAWLEARAPGAFQVLGFHAHEGYLPAPSHLYQAQKLGGYVAPSWGVYQSTRAGLQRTGGHLISMTVMQNACGVSPQITWRDPDDAGPATTFQSWFTSRSDFLVPTADNFRTTSNGNYFQGVLYRFSNSNTRFLDGLVVIMPLKFGTPTQTPGEIAIHNPVQPVGLLLPAVQKVREAAARVEDMVSDPMMLAYYATTAPEGALPARVVRIDALDGMFTTLHTPANAGPLAISRFGDLYIGDGRTIAAMNAWSPTPAIAGSILLPAIAEALAYDDSTDLIFALNIAQRQIMRVDRLLAGPAQVLPLPSGLPLGADASMAIGPTGYLYLASDAAQAIYELEEDPAIGAYAVRNIIASNLGHAPLGLQVDNRNNIFFILNDEIQELEKNAAGTWSPAPNSILAGMPAHRRLAISKGRTNFDFDTMSGPAFVEISPSDPPGIPDCYANCDLSRENPILNVDDFTCFINAYATAQSLPHEAQILHYANCDQSTAAPVLNVDDFTCFINAFAAGCP